MTYSKYVEHKAQAGERWDDLAYKYYGNGFQVSGIIKANPDIAISPFLPENETIIIPIPEDDTNLLSNQDSLPVWKREQGKQAT